jgi:hypothetical protein
MRLLSAQKRSVFGKLLRFVPRARNRTALTCQDLTGKPGVMPPRQDGATNGPIPLARTIKGQQGNPEPRCRSRATEGIRKLRVLGTLGLGLFVRRTLPAANLKRFRWDSHGIDPLSERRAVLVHVRATHERARVSVLDRSQENCIVRREGVRSMFSGNVHAGFLSVHAEKWTRPRTLQFSCHRYTTIIRVNDAAIG